jgi:hypothetical protein
MLGEHTKALELREKVYTLRCRVLGETHPRTLASLGSLALSYDKIGDSAHAIALQERLCDLRAQKLGETHPDVVKARKYLATLRKKLSETK